MMKFILDGFGPCRGSRSKGWKWASMRMTSSQTNVTEYLDSSAKDSISASKIRSSNDIPRLRAAYQRRHELQYLVRLPARRAGLVMGPPIFFHMSYPGITSRRATPLDLRRPESRPLDPSQNLCPSPTWVLEDMLQDPSPISCRLIFRVGDDIGTWSHSMLQHSLVLLDLSDQSPLFRHEKVGVISTS